MGKTEYLKCEKAADGRGGNIEVVDIEGLAALSMDVVIQYMNESVRRHYAVLWRAGHTQITNLVDLVSFKADVTDKVINRVSVMSREDLIAIADMTPQERHVFLKLSPDERKKLIIAKDISLEELAEIVS